MSNERTDALREKLKAELKALGVESFLLTFRDPDTNNWTWAAGSDDLFSIASGRIAVGEIERAQSALLEERDNG